MPTPVTPTTALSRSIADALESPDPTSRLDSIASNLVVGTDVAEAIALVRHRLSLRSLDSDVRERLELLASAMRSLRVPSVERARAADAAYVRAVMSFTGLSQNELAEHCGVSRRTVAYWMHATNGISTNARAVMDDLVTGSRQVESHLRSVVRGREITYTEGRYVVDGGHLASHIDLDGLSDSFVDSAVSRAMLS